MATTLTDGNDTLIGTPGNDTIYMPELVMILSLVVLVTITSQIGLGMMS